MADEGPMTTFIVLQRILASTAAAQAENEMDYDQNDKYNTGWLSYRLRTKHMYMQCTMSVL